MSFRFCVHEAYFYIILLSISNLQVILNIDRRDIRVGFRAHLELQFIAFLLSIGSCLFLSIQLYLLVRFEDLIQ